MSELERLYTLEEIAKITSLTTKTVRNHLRTGTLRGRKIGGQWRFTASDIREMMSQEGVTSESDKEQKQTVIDFLEGCNPDVEGEVQICTIMDLYLPKEAAEQKNGELRTLIDAEKDGTRIILQYHYADTEQKARFLLFAPPMLVGKIMELLT